MPNVYVIKRNADMTEGRGPMVIDIIVDSLDLAKKYVLAQRGIMGSSIDPNPKVYAPKMYNVQYAYTIGQRMSNCVWSYNGWDIEEFSILNENSFEFLEDKTICWACGIKIIIPTKKVYGNKYCHACNAFLSH